MVAAAAGVGAGRKVLAEAALSVSDTPERSEERAALLFLLVVTHTTHLPAMVLIQRR